MTRRTNPGLPIGTGRLGASWHIPGNGAKRSPAAEAVGQVMVRVDMDQRLIPSVGASVGPDPADSAIVATYRDPSVICLTSIPADCQRSCEPPPSSLGFATESGVCQNDQGAVLAPG